MLKSCDFLWFYFLTHKYLDMELFTAITKESCPSSRTVISWKWTHALSGEKAKALPPASYNLYFISLDSKNPLNIDINTGFSSPFILNVWIPFERMAAACFGLQEYWSFFSFPKTRLDENKLTIVNRIKVLSHRSSPHSYPPIT